LEKEADTMIKRFSPEQEKRLIIEDFSGQRSSFCSFGLNRLLDAPDRAWAEQSLGETPGKHRQGQAKSLFQMIALINELGKGPRAGEENNWGKAFFNANFFYFIAATDNSGDTLGHSQLVASYTLLLAKEMGIENSQYLMDMERGALLHDIGKVAIPDTILKKPGALTPDEREIIKGHSLIGYEMIKDVPFLQRAASMVLYHHEHFDGNGYPFGLAGDEIPLEARIFALADTLDAITSDRPYRRGQSFTAAMKEIERVKGKQFDPLITDVLLSIPLERWSLTKGTALRSLRLPTVN
jgi:putative nucleotidyltransferase with HDIG domain